MKPFLSASAVGIGAGLVWHFTFRDSDVGGKAVEKAKLPPATPAFTGGDQWIDLKVRNLEPAPLRPVRPPAPGPVSTH